MYNAPNKYYSMFPSMYMNTSSMSMHKSNANDARGNQYPKAQNQSQNQSQNISQSKSQNKSQNRSQNRSQNNQEHIMLMFYQPFPKDPWVNRLVAWMDKPFSHVEIGFADGHASSIFAGTCCVCRVEILALVVVDSVFSIFHST
jgi:hypothetical protein